MKGLERYKLTCMYVGCSLLHVVPLVLDLHSQVVKNTCDMQFRSRVTKGGNCDTCGSGVLSLYPRKYENLGSKIW